MHAPSKRRVPAAHAHPPPASWPKAGHRDRGFVLKHRCDHGGVVTSLASQTHATHRQPVQREFCSHDVPENGRPSPERQVPSPVPFQPKRIGTGHATGTLAPSEATPPKRPHTKGQDTSSARRLLLAKQTPNPHREASLTAPNPNHPRAVENGGHSPGTSTPGVLCRPESQQRH